MWILKSSIIKSHHFNHLPSVIVKITTIFWCVDVPAIKFSICLIKPGDWGSWVLVEAPLVQLFLTTVQKRQGLGDCRPASEVSLRLQDHSHHPMLFSLFICFLSHICSWAVTVSTSLNKNWKWWENISFSKWSSSSFSGKWFCCITYSRLVW